MFVFLKLMIWKGIILYVGVRREGYGYFTVSLREEKEKRKSRRGGGGRRDGGGIIQRLGFILFPCGGEG